MKSMIVLTLALQAVGAAGENWASFHNGGSTSIDAANLPLRWSPQRGIAWRIELPGYGQSAPLVWNGRVYLTAVAGDDKATNIVLAYDAATGRKLWRQSFAASIRQKISYMVSRAAPTPLVDEHGLYVFFESGDLYALSHDGATRWRRPYFDEKRTFQNGHGYGASPAQTAEAVILLVDHRGPSYLTAVSKRTGKPLWTTTRSSRSSWSSPHVMQVDGRTQIVVSSTGSVDGYDAATGGRLWSYSGVTGNQIPSATIVGNRVYVGASISRREPNALSAAASNCCLEIASQHKPGYKLLWQAQKAVCHYVSPLVHRGCAYYATKAGVVYCLDASTGKRHYARRIGSACWAQPIACGDRIYFFGKNGVTTVLRAGSTFERLAANRLWPEDEPPRPERSYEYEPQSDKDTRPRQPVQAYLDPIVYAAVAVDGAFFVRLGTHLYRIGAVQQTAQPVRR